MKIKAKKQKQKQNEIFRRTIVNGKEVYDVTEAPIFLTCVDPSTTFKKYGRIFMTPYHFFSFFDIPISN